MLLSRSGAGSGIGKGSEHLERDPASSRPAHSPFPHSSRRRRGQGGRARLPQPLPSSTSLPSPPAFLRAASPATRPAAQNHASHAPARGWRSVHADPRAEHGTGAAPTTRAIAVQPNPRCISADSRGPQAMHTTCSFNCLSWRICFLPVKYVC